MQINIIKTRHYITNIMLKLNNYRNNKHVCEHMVLPLPVGV